MSFVKISYEQRIKELTQRAKEENPKTEDCTIGESAYVEVLNMYIREWRHGLTFKDSLIKKQKELEEKLIKYYQHREMFDKHVQISNRYGRVLIEVEKDGCPICKKVVRIFDGRNAE